MEKQRVYLLGIVNHLFLDSLKKLFCNVKHLNPEIICHAHLVNMEPTEVISADEISYSHHQESDYSKYSHLNFYKGEAGICVNLRAQLIHEMLGKINENDVVIYLDADSVVRKNLQGMIDFINNAGITSHLGIRKTKYLGSSLGFKNTPIVREFVKEWYETIFFVNERFTCWDEDQVVFSKLAFSPKYKKHVKSLPFTYCDWDLTPKTHIWCGKGKRKFQKKFINEQNKTLG